MTGIIDTRDRFAGCLLGLAVGDALGGPLEFMEAAVIARRHGRVAEMLGGGWLKLAPGQTTDDTDQMLILAQSLLRHNAFVPDDVAAGLVAWYEGGPLDIGEHTRAVLGRVAEGLDWKNASTRVQRLSPSAAGNGSVMRCAPVALFDFSDASARLEHARAQSEITHAHQECQWGCALVCSFIAHAATTGIRDAALDRALAECSDSPGHILKRATLATSKLKTDLTPSGYVLDTIDCALWAMMNSESFEDAVVAAVNLGGDADTIGAVCGAMAGAFYGASAIPQRWLDKLQQRERINSVAQQLADRQG